MSSGMDGTVANDGTAAAAAAGSASPAIDAVRNTTALMCPSMNHGTTCASNYVVYSSEASAYLADLIAQQLSVERGTVIRKQFKGGEKYLRVLMNEKYQLVGQDVIYVAATHTDDDLLELVRLGCAFAAYGSRRRIFVIPFLGYSTMERQVLPGEVITSKVNARILSSIPNSKLGNIFLFMDLHVQSLLQYLEGPCTRMELYAEQALLEGIKTHLDLSQPFMFASADLGRPLWVESFARKFNVDVAFVRKSRHMQETSVLGVVGEVTGKHVIIYDDMTRTGGTLVKAADAYMARGASRVSAVLSHFALASEEVIRMLEESCISVIISTNTHPISMHPSVAGSKPSKFRILDVSPIFGEAIMKLMHE
ncbi:unnamed protein product [Closterium sp. NIES-64]|nr:unnamed protein product [Closterium sp. NIES-64]